MSFSKHLLILGIAFFLKCETGFAGDHFLKVASKDEISILQIKGSKTPLFTLHPNLHLDVETDAPRRSGSASLSPKHKTHLHRIDFTLIPRTPFKTRTNTEQTEPAWLQTTPPSYAEALTKLSIEAEAPSETLEDLLIKHILPIERLQKYIGRELAALGHNACVPCKNSCKQKKGMITGPCGDLLSPYIDLHRQVLKHFIYADTLGNFSPLFHRYAYIKALELLLTLNQQKTEHFQQDPSHMIGIEQQIQVHYRALSEMLASMAPEHIRSHPLYLHISHETALMVPAYGMPFDFETLHTYLNNPYEKSSICIHKIQSQLLAHPNLREQAHQLPKLLLNDFHSEAKDDEAIRTLIELLLTDGHSQYAYTIIFGHIKRTQHTKRIKEDSSVPLIILHSLMGRCAFANENYEDTIVHHQALQQQTPIPAITDRFSPFLHAHYETACALVELGKPAEALSILQTLLPRITSCVIGKQNVESKISEIGAVLAE